jgi:hypothetical protein
MNIVDIPLYNRVKQEADKKFQAKTGIYKSAWIVREYKKRGGLYTGKKNKNQGLLRWFREDWVDISKPGLPACGRVSATQGDYPLCRPKYRITKDTPKTVSEVQKTLSPKEIQKRVTLKRRVQWKKNVKF